MSRLDPAHLRNLALAIERAHLSVTGYVIAPYAAGKSVMAEDETVLGTILIEMGGATTSIGIFHEGKPGLCRQRSGWRHACHQ